MRNNEIYTVAFLKELLCYILRITVWMLCSKHRSGTENLRLERNQCVRGRYFLIRNAVEKTARTVRDIAYPKRLP